jgi:hypothetical protein
MLLYNTDLLLNTSLNNKVISGYGPFNLSLNPSALNGISGNKLYKIVYTFDNLETVTQTLYYTPSGDLTLPFKFEAGDPRNFKKNKTFYLPNTVTKDFNIKIESYTIGNATPQTINFTLSLSAPKMDGTLNAYFSSLHLIHTRMFGPNNNILYVFESKEPNYFIPIIINWKERPYIPPPPPIDDSYRPYRILAPFEDQSLQNNNYRNIDFFNDQEAYDTDPRYPKY